MPRNAELDGIKRYVGFSDNAGNEYDAHCQVTPAAEVEHARIKLTIVGMVTPRMKNDIVSGVVARLRRVSEFDVTDVKEADSGFTATVHMPAASATCDIPPLERLANGFEAFAISVVERCGYMLQLEAEEAVAA